MDKKDEELKKHLEEDLKKRMYDTEFNNYEEDVEVSKEEEIKEKEENFLEEKEKSDKKNIIIIALGAVVVILVVVLLFFLLFGGKKENNNSDNNSPTEENGDNNDNSNNENDTAQVINEDDYNYVQAKVYLNKYVLVPAKSGDKQALTDLDGNILSRVSKSWAIYEGTDSSLYLVNLDYKTDGKFNIKRVKDNIVKDIFTEKATGLLLGKEKENLIGVYKEEKNNDVIYIFNGDKYDTINLDTHAAYTYYSSEKESKYIFNSKYVITFGEHENESFSNFGLYDLKNKKQVIDGSFDKIHYLHDDIFTAVKNGYAGVINKDGKELLPYEYDLVSYSNGLYFAGKNNKLYVFDSNFNDLNTFIDVPNLEEFVYTPCCGSINPFDLTSFKSYVIVRIGNDPDKLSDYMAIDKKGAITQLGKGHLTIEGNFIIKSNDSDNYLLLYDANLKIQHKFDVGKKAIDLSNAHFYLGNTLVLNNKQLYNLSNNTNKGTTSWYRRTSQEYEIRIDFKGDTGTITVSSGEEVLKKLENVSVEEFLKANNNGITITKNKFIYNAGGVIILDRVEPAPADALLDFVGLFE